MAQIVFTLEDGSEVTAMLTDEVLTVGRHPDSLVVLSSGSVSGQHATIRKRGGSYFVQDLGSTNGTRLNGVEVEEARLSDGDHLAFGQVTGTVYLEETPPQPVSEPVAAVTPVELPDSALLPERYSPVPKVKRPGPSGPMPTRRVTRPVRQYKQSSGIGGFFLFLLFLAFAFVVGLHVRHGQEHAGSVLLLDVMEKLRADVVKETEAPAAAAPQTPEPAAPVKEPAVEAGTTMESGAGAAAAPMSMMGQ